MKTLITALVLATVATSALADRHGDHVIRDIYVQKQHSEPFTEQVCRDVQVQSAPDQRFDQNGAIVGGIVGGIIGSQIGKGDGNRAATAIGAITGTIIGGKQETPSPEYRIEERCTTQTRYRTTYKNVYSHSEITFNYHGRQQIIRFQK